jgi:hypothetical protein
MSSQPIRLVNKGFPERKVTWKARYREVTFGRSSLASSGTQVSQRWRKRPIMMGKP